MHPQNQRAVRHLTPPNTVLRSFYGQALRQSSQASRTEHRLEAGPEAQKQKSLLIATFLRLADRRNGANPAKDESLTHQNQGIHQESNTKPPEGGFHSQIYGWASRIPALCERSPPWRKRLRANP